MWNGRAWAMVIGGVVIAPVWALGVSGSWTPGVLAAADDEAINIFSGNLGNAVWTLLIFALVVFILGKFAWGPLLRVLQRREEFIRESLATAKREREAAEAQLKEYEARLDKAREEASVIVEDGRRDAELTARRILDEAREASKTEQQRAIREIGIARDTALRDLYERSTQLAIEMAGLVLKRELTAQDQQRLIEEALGKLREHDRQGSAN